MDALINQVKHEASSLDEIGRNKILNGLRDLALSMEMPAYMIQTNNHLVRLLQNHGATQAICPFDVEIWLSKISKLPLYVWELI